MTFVDRADADGLLVIPLALPVLRDEFDDACAERGDELMVVGDDDDADAVAAQPVDEVDDLHPSTAVLPERRFVKNQHAWGGGERCGHGEPAFFASGQRVRVDVLVPAEVEAFKQVVRAAAGFVGRDAGAQRPEHDFVDDAASGELVFGVLENVGDAGGEFG